MIKIYIYKIYIYNEIHRIYKENTGYFVKLIIVGDSVVRETNLIAGFLRQLLLGNLRSNNRSIFENIVIYAEG